MICRILVAFFILLTVVVPLFAQEEKPQTEQVAIIESIEGDCETRASEKADWVAGSVGATLPKQGFVSTGFASKVVIKFAANITVEMGSLTQIKIDEFFLSKEKLEAKLKTKIGSLKVTVEKGAIQSDFVVVTPNTTTAVKGTGFTLRSSSYGDKLEVQKDSVRVTNRAGASLTVREGDETNSNLDSDSECRKADSSGNPLPPGALSEEQESARENLSSGPTPPSVPLGSSNPDLDRQQQKPEYSPPE